MIALSYDLHLHSCLSPCGDDDMTPANIVGMSALKGLELIALTDHNSAKNCPAFLKMAEEYAAGKPVWFWDVNNLIDYCSTKGYRVRNVSEFGLKRAPQSWCYVKEVSENGPTIH